MGCLSFWIGGLAFNQPSSILGRSWWSMLWRKPKLRNLMLGTHATLRVNSVESPHAADVNLSVPTGCCFGGWSCLHATDRCCGLSGIWTSSKRVSGTTPSRWLRFLVAKVMRFSQWTLISNRAGDIPQRQQIQCQWWTFSRPDSQGSRVVKRIYFLCIWMYIEQYSLKIHRTRLSTHTSCD